MDSRKITHEVRLAHWSEVITARQESGMTVRSYCKSNGICEKVYYYWQRQLREKVCKTMSVSRKQEPQMLSSPENEATGMPEFVPLAMPDSKGAAVTVRLGDFIVAFSNGAEYTIVDHVLRVLSKL